MVFQFSIARCVLDLNLSCEDKNFSDDCINWLGCFVQTNFNISLETLLFIFLHGINLVPQTLTLPFKRAIRTWPCISDLVSLCVHRENKTVPTAGLSDFRKLLPFIIEIRQSQGGNSYQWQACGYYFVVPFCVLARIQLVVATHAVILSVISPDTTFRIAHLYFASPFVPRLQTAGYW